MPSKPPVQRQTKTAHLEAESFQSIARRMLDNARGLYAAGKPIATREIQECVKSLVAHAKDRGVQAERMLIELKQTWYTIAESGPHPKSDVISVLVTMCIREYYGADSETSKG